MVKRRTLLTVGSMAIFGGIGNATAEIESVAPQATGDPGSDQQLPLETKGKLITKFEKSDSEDTYIVERHFESRAMRERYGIDRMEYEAVEVPSQLVPREVVHGEKSRFIEECTRIIGTWDEHREAESNLMEANENTLAELPINTSGIPLYQYEQSSNAGSGDMADRTSPINVAWGVRDEFGSFSSTWVKNTMENASGNPLVPWNRSHRTKLFGDNYEVDQYVDHGGTIKSTDEHVMEHISDWQCPLGTKQWHIRLTDVDGGMGDISVVGQSHRDPCLHGASLPRDWNSSDFYLVNSRKAAAHWWLAQDENLGMWVAGVANEHPNHPTHDGFVWVIDYNAPRNHEGTPDPHEYDP